MLLPLVQVMATILSNLEVGDARYLRVLSQLHATCTVSFHKQSPSSLADSHPLVAAILSLCPQPKQGRFTFDVPSLASKLKAPLATVQRELQQLQVRRRFGKRARFLREFTKARHVSSKHAKSVGRRAVCRRTVEVRQRGRFSRTLANHHSLVTNGDSQTR